MTDNGLTLGQIDTSRPHTARMYDYYLGGKDHYESDQECADGVIALFPAIKIVARTNRSFMHRATRWLAREAGIRQFLDIGTGIPTEPNLHQVAQSVAPDSRIVYTDHDPIVLTHAQALLHSTPEGRTAYVQADVREPERILSAPELHETLDLSQPVALSLNALLHFVSDEFRPYELVRQLVDALPSGSYLVVSHCTPDFEPETWTKLVEIYRNGGIPAQVRSRSEVEAFFAGLELVEPGVVSAHRWKPDEEAAAATVTDGEVSMWAGVARKP
ncbi:SAM-dependent methyltransferase [Streptomyces sp. XD-27]|uniref:SAM-dependent methyltransferase n=1 Tax=Streptomyces sp. XD-27 TaxID=3062779 RepID=UPI0026F44DC7|nr:SAM-dependent methyltransferase [Streptomyces sp. XD-27]WKX68851.1 SAM-dependent methyltransferase [Streptomyces sp. XD-27]